MSEEFFESLRKKLFYIAVFAVILSAAAVSIIQRRKPDNDVNQIELAQESSREPLPEIDKNTDDEEKLADAKDEIAKDLYVNENEDSVPSIDSNLDEDKKEEINDKEQTDQEMKVDEKAVGKTDEKDQDMLAKDVMNTELGNYSFDEESGLNWPVKENVLIEYSEDKPVYFQTTNTFRTNNGLIIAAKQGEDVKCATDGIVTNIYNDDEYGNMLEISIGSNYKITYGQVKDICVSVGDKVKSNQKIASVAKTTSFFEKEGDNVYMKIEENDKTVDPMLLLN